MDYIDSMENYYKDDAELKLFDSLSTDIFYDAEETNCVRDPGIGHWLDGATVSDSYDGLVSDCMMLSDSMQIGLNPSVQSEHSYSVTHNSDFCSEIKQEPDSEFEFEALNAIDPNLAFSGSEICQVGSPCDVKQEVVQIDDEFGYEMQPDDDLNCEDANVPVATQDKKNAPTFVVTCTTQLMGRQPTIIVTNSRQSIPFNPGTVSRAFVAKSENICQTAAVSPAKDRVKEECRPVYIFTSNLQTNCEENPVPLTPPASSSSCSSDSECSQSPKRQATNSPRTVQPLYQQQSVTSFLAVQQKHSTPASNVLPSSGMLVLTEEEKRTMIAEGYPVPTRFPLSKQEEKNLKKVQRKIKNKMSAQESRRKKKDYVDSLEKKLEASNQENSQLKKQLEHLVSDNKSLLSQLHKLQSLANSLSPLQSSTCLAVFVLFFALGVGFLSPSWSSSISMSPGVHPIHSEDAILQGSLASDYFTPSMRSRTLKSYDDDNDTAEPIHRHSLLDWFLGLCRPYHSSSPTHDVTTNLSDTVVDAVADKVVDITSVVELKSTNTSWIHPGQHLNVTYAPDVVSVLV